MKDFLRIVPDITNRALGSLADRIEEGAAGLAAFAEGSRKRSGIPYGG